MILVCAPTRVEARACRRGLADARARGVEVLRTGVGGRRAAAALTRRLRSGAVPSLVVSSGFAGALTRGIPLHAVVTAVGVHRLRAGGAAPVAAASRPGALRVAAGALPCDVATSEGVWLAGAPSLRSPWVVDMESAALAEVAAAAGVPFQVLRVVTDTPDRAFPPFVAAIGTALGAPSTLGRIRAAARAAAGAARTPRGALRVLRSSLAAARALRAAWSDRARDDGARKEEGGRLSATPFSRTGRD